MRMWQQSFFLRPANRIDKRGNVKDERDLSTAEDRRSPDTAKMGKQSPQRLDDCLKLAHQLIDDDACALPAELNHHNAFPGWYLGIRAKQLAQADEGKGLAAQIEEAPVAGNILLFDALDNRVERNDIRRFAHTDQKTVNDCQRQRQTDGKG